MATPTPATKAAAAATTATHTAVSMPESPPARPYRLCAGGQVLVTKSPGPFGPRGFQATRGVPGVVLRRSTAGHGEAARRRRAASAASPSWANIVSAFGDLRVVR